MKDKKNYKFTNDLKRIGPKLKWFLFTEIQDMKLTSDYINFICPAGDKRNENSNPVEDLKNLIENTLIREFSPNIRKLKSFNLLVDSIMNNIMKKSFSENDLKEMESF